MSIEDLERRLHDLEVVLEHGKKRRQDARERAKVSRGRRFYRYVIGRVLALIVAYPLLVAFLWVTDTPRPWVHALTPVITVFVYFLVAPKVQRMLSETEDEE
jgi:hypothetical protein